MTQVQKIAHPASVTVCQCAKPCSRLRHNFKLGVLARLSSSHSIFSCSLPSLFFSSHFNSFFIPCFACLPFAAPASPPPQHTTHSLPCRQGLREDAWQKSASHGVETIPTDSTHVPPTKETAAPTLCSGKRAYLARKGRTGREVRGLARLPPRRGV
jgi:hypothetical protein